MQTALKLALLVSLGTLCPSCFLVTDAPERPDGYLADETTDVVGDLPEDSVGDPTSDVSSDADSGEFVEDSVCTVDEARCHGRESQNCGDDLSWAAGTDCDDGTECRGDCLDVDGRQQDCRTSCLEIPDGYQAFCSEDVSCTGDLSCQLGLCLANATAERAGLPCLTDLECAKPLRCSGLGRCSDGSPSDNCLSDLDCWGASDVCNPIARKCSAGDLGSACVGEQGCAAPHVCGPSNVCQDGLDGSACESDDHCAPGTPICADDICSDGETGDPCYNDDDCAAGNRCEDVRTTDTGVTPGRCLTPTEGDSCSGDSDCGSLYCAEDGRCYNGSREDPCREDTECFDSLRCGPEGFCQLGVDGEPCDDSEDCAPNSDICQDGRCQDGSFGDACDTIEDCRPPSRCGPTGTCQFGWSGDPCEEDEQCGADLACAGDGVCRGDGDICDEQSDCAGGFSICNGHDRCDDGQESALCWDDEDCLDGLSCVSNRCFDGSAGDLCANPEDCGGSANTECLIATCPTGTCEVEIEADYCLIDEQCIVEGTVPEESPCVECAASESATAWSPDDTNSCEGPGVSGQCVAGSCQLADCPAGWEDCDSLFENGCETRIELNPSHCGGCDERCVDGQVCAVAECASVCPDSLSVCDGSCYDLQSDEVHCGECDNPCGDSLNRNVVFECHATSCTEVDCPSNQWNVDRRADNGCEYACVVDGDGTELCDGLDNDCDGLIDEDTNLLTDADHCGGCDQDCSFDNATAVSCQRGACLAVTCEAGFSPGDSPLVGCGPAPSFTEELWVDGTTTAETRDGSLGNPFKTIGEALLEAEEGALITVLAAPTYAEAVEINKANLTLRGESRGPAAIGPDGPVSAVVTITATGVRLENLRIIGGVTGIAVRGTEDVPVVVELHNLDVLSVIAPDDDEDLGMLPANGISLEYADDSVVSGVIINIVEGASSTETHVAGTAAVGISIADSDNVQVVGSIIRNIASGSSRGGGDSNAPEAAAIRVLSSTDTSVRHNTMGAITGGVGGAGFTEPAGMGGLAAGVLLLDSSDCVVQGNGVTGLTGGEGGESTFESVSAGMGGIAAGVHLEQTSGCSFDDNHFETMQGGASGNFHPVGVDPRPTITQQGYGLWLDENSLATTIAATNTLTGGPGEPVEPILFLYGQSDQRIAGYELTAHLNPTNWGKIAVFESNRIELADLIVANATGGAGCNTTPCSGETAAGIRLEDCFRCSVSNVEVHGITGGRGGFAPNGRTDGGNAGNSLGLGLFGDTSASVSHLLVYSLDGGDPGLRTDDSELDGKVGHGICVFSDSDSNTTIEHLTCFGGTSLNLTEGIVQSATVTGSIAVTNSIISNLDTGCAQNDSDNDPEQLDVQYTILHACGAETENVSTSDVSESLPLFEAAGSDFRLVCTGESCSPGVDSGELSQTCNLEPPPNGGRVNLGFYGNTNEAATKPTADDDFPCPSE